MNWAGNPARGWGRILALGIVFGTRVCLAQSQSIPQEYQLKAAYLTKMFDFVKWPAGALPQERAEICVVGEYSFGVVLSQQAERAGFGGRKVKVRFAKKGKDLSGCNVVFVSASAPNRYEEIFSELRNRNVLTVGETEQFLGEGGMVALRYAEGRLLLEVNLGATNAAQLKIDSRLLSMATRVVNARPGGIT